MYELKLIAFFADTYPQTGVIQFEVTLIDYCKNPTISDPGQATAITNVEYFYTDDSSGALALN